MSRGASGKGAAFERKVCCQLSLWWSGTDDGIFWRTSNSGGRATVRGRSGKNTKFHCGDVSAIDPTGQPLLDVFVFELKKGYSRHTIADLLDKSPRAREQLYEGWFAKAERVRKSAGAVAWALVVKRDQREPLLFCPYKTLLELCFDNRRSPSAHFWFLIEEIPFHISCLLFSEFLQIVSPERVQELARRLSPEGGKQC